MGCNIKKIGKAKKFYTETFLKQSKSNQRTKQNIKYLQQLANVDLTQRYISSIIYCASGPCYSTFPGRVASYPGPALGSSSNFGWAQRVVGYVPYPEEVAN